MDREKLAPQAGFEPATLRLTAGCSAVELLRNTGREPRVGTKHLFYRPRLQRVNCPAAPVSGVRIDTGPQPGERPVKSTFKLFVGLCLLARPLLAADGVLIVENTTVAGKTQTNQ